MQILNYWKQFEHTGRVEDYLSYVSEEVSDFGKHSDTISYNGSVQMTNAERTGTMREEKREQSGANPYAGIHMGNGNDIETDAYRRI